MIWVESCQFYNSLTLISIKHDIYNLGIIFRYPNMAWLNVGASHLYNQKSNIHYKVRKSHMSHHTTVVNATQNIYINSCNEARKAGGLKPLPTDTPVSKATQQMEIALVGKVKTQWTNVFASVTLPAGNTNFGFLYPASGLKAGAPIPCVVDQINTLFKNWNLPGTTDIAKDMTETITTELSSQGGLLGVTNGSKQVNSNESIDWMVGYANVNISQDTAGYLYVFAAALEI